MNLYKTKGIYGIINKINNKIYIGQTSVNFGDRRDIHYSKLRHDVNDNLELQNDWNVYGEQNFEFVILKELKEKKDLDKWEKYYIKIYKKKNLSYNIADGGKGAPGVILSEEAKRKIAAKNRINGIGRKASDETKRKMSLSHLGKKQTEQHKINSANARRGKKMSFEAVEKNRLAHQGSKSNLATHTEDEIREAKILLKKNYTIKQIKEITGISESILYSLKNNTRWKHVII